MLIICEKCLAILEDEYRTTSCPHEAFAANDGNNNFAYHPEATLIQLEGRSIREQRELLLQKQHEKWL